MTRRRRTPCRPGVSPDGGRVGRVHARDDLDAARGAPRVTLEIVRAGRRRSAHGLGAPRGTAGRTSRCGWRTARRCWCSPTRTGVADRSSGIDLGTDEVRRVGDQRRRRRSRTWSVEPGRGTTAYALRDVVRGPATRCGSTWREAKAASRAAGPRAPRRDGPRLPGTLTEVETTAEDGAAVRGWLVLPRAPRPRPAPLLLWIHGGPLVVERVDVAVEPVAGGPRLRSAAARPGAVHRLRAGVHRPRLGPLGRRAVHRPDGDHGRGRGARPTSTRPVPRRWAARSAATWPTGSPATRTGSGRSSPTQPVGAGPVRADHRRAPSTGAAR